MPRRTIVGWNAPAGPASAGPDALDAARVLDRSGAELLVLEQDPDQPRTDPVLLLAALARDTRRLGLVAGQPVADQPPFLLARTLGTLDHVCRGRSGWLVDESRPELVVRDDTARWQDAATASPEVWAEAVAEHVDTACALWDSWEPGAVVADRSTGVFVDHEKVHAVHAEGQYFSTRGPLNNPRPPQGRPVLVGTAGPGGLPAAAVDVVVVRATDAAGVCALVAAVREASPALVLIAVSAELPGAENPAPAAPAVRLRGDAATVAAELLRLQEMADADGVVLTGALTTETVAATAAPLLRELRAAGAVPADPPAGWLHDRLLAVPVLEGGAR